MADLKKLDKIEMSPDTIQKNILTNVIKMLTERGLLMADNLDKNIENIIKNFSEDNSYIIELDKPVYNKNSFGIKLNLQKITGINKSPDISNFLINNKDIPKIIVVTEINKKALQFILTKYPHTEIFLQDNLMNNLVDNTMVPKHQLLTKEEKRKVMKEYGVKKSQLPLLLSGDPVARYYNMKPGDICRIIRPSEKSAFSPTYRIVVKGNPKD